MSQLWATVPISHKQRLPQLVDVERLQRKDADLKSRQEQDFDRHRNARELSDLPPGDVVWLPNQSLY
jgi:hypothetical protein